MQLKTGFTFFETLNEDGVFVFQT